MVVCLVSGAFKLRQPRRLFIENPNSQCGWKPRSLHEFCDERLQGWQAVTGKVQWR
jgi:hypothetical protein